jgi:hypothetical protein
VLLIQVSDLIFKFARFFGVWEARDNHVCAWRGARTVLGWPVSHNLSDPEFVGWHSLDFPNPGDDQERRSLRVLPSRRLDLRV